MGPIEKSFSYIEDSIAKEKSEEKNGLKLLPGGRGPTPNGK